MHQFLLFALCSLFLACGPEESSSQNPEQDCELTETDQAVVDQLNDELAYPFNSPDPEQEDALLSPLINYLADTKLVGLGEATHGTSEFYQFKDKLFRLLVTEAGFKAIIFEIPWGNALVVNDFVTQGIGTADEVIDQTWYWTYDTQEVRDLAQWLHDYNEGRSDEDKIYFVGCDPQGGDFQIELRHLAYYLDRTAPDDQAELLAKYDGLPTESLGTYSSASSAIHDENIAATQFVYDYMTDHAAELISRSSEQEYEIALMAAHVIQQRELIYRTSDYGETRDALMAVYAEWWQRIFGESSKVAIWAHNRHVWDGGAINANLMGTFLDQRHGDNYKAVGFSFSGGSFNAFLASADGNFASGVRNQVIESASCNTVNHLLGEVTGDQHYLIFEEFTGAASTYFRANQPFTQLGAGFNASYIQNYTQSIPLSRVYDVLVHFDRTKGSELK